MSTRTSKRLKNKDQRTMNIKIELPSKLFEDDEEIEIGSEDTSTGETTDTDSSTDYEPEPDEALSDEPEEREKENTINKMITDREQERKQKKIARKQK